MTDTKIYARCSNPTVDYLTDGKLYEVKSEWGGALKVVADDDVPQSFYWEASKYATWERVEQQDPPRWALDKAAKALFYSSYADAQKQALDNDVLNSIRAHAATLAKYETEPVDAVLSKARELLAGLHLKSNGCSRVAVANSYTEGDYDESIETQAVIAALKLPAMESSQ